MAIGKDINTSRLICDVTPDEHKEIKQRARNSGMTVRQYIYNSLILRMQLEDKKQVKFASKD